MVSPVMHTAKMNTPHKVDRGFVTSAHSGQYTFTKEKDSTGDGFSVVFRVRVSSGFVSPQEFFADVRASNPPPGLKGCLTRIAPQFNLGTFSYRRPGGTTTTADADDIEITVKSIVPTQSPPKQSGYDIDM